MIMMGLLGSQADGLSINHPSQPMGLLQRINNNPGGAQLMLAGLGMLGAKRQNQLNPYLVMSNQAFDRISAKKDRAIRQQLADAQVGGIGKKNALIDAQIAKMAQSDPTKWALTTIGAGDGMQQRAFVNPENPYMDPLAIGQPFAVKPGVEINMGGQKGLESLSKADAARVAEASTELDKYNATLPLLDAIEQDMAIFPTGPDARAWLTARKAGSIVGVGDKEKLAAGERMDKNMNKLVSENMSFLKGAMSEGERQFTREFSLGMNTTPEANLAYMGFLRAVAERAAKRAPLMRKWFYDNDGSLAGFDEYWQQYIEENPVPIPEIDTGVDDELEALKRELGVE